MNKQKTMSYFGKSKKEKDPVAGGDTPMADGTMSWEGPGWLREVRLFQI